MVHSAYSCADFGLVVYAHSGKVLVESTHEKHERLFWERLFDERMFGWPVSAQNTFTLCNIYACTFIHFAFSEVMHRYSLSLHIHAENYNRARVYIRKKKENA